MHFGTHLRELARLRAGVALSFLLAALIAFSVMYKISVSPPGLASRDLEMATATTHVLVDTSQSAVLDVKYGSGDFDSLTARAVLLGNLMASQPVRQYIGARAHLSPELILATTPLTADFPRPLATNGQEKHQSDLLRSTNQYRLNIQVNPTVPIIDVYAQAPDPHAAAALANGAVEGLRDYLHARDTARGADVTHTNEVKLTQLGAATGRTIDNGAGIQAAVLTFCFVLALGCAATIFASRVRRGWTLAGASEPAA